jgi:NAD(P)-dependent dehydrogenase (short-subunit alcohol dehydrogenase family)
MSSIPTNGTILLAGASRGLGLGLASEYLGRGWHVIATARTPDTATGLAQLKAKYPDHLIVETLDVADPASAQALAERLATTTLDVLFVVAGVSGHSGKPVHQVPHAEIAHEFITNATSPIALAEALHASLTPQTTIAFMTSILGSIGSNAGGGMELYRATKAALNMLASCYALRHKASAVLLLHPGWVRTELGGEAAPLDVATSVRGLADVVAWHGVKPGISYLDYQGNRLPW